MRWCSLSIEAAGWVANQSCVLLSNQQDFFPQSFAKFAMLKLEARPRMCSREEFEPSANFTHDGNGGVPSMSKSTCIRTSGCTTSRAVLH